MSDHTISVYVDHHGRHWKVPSTASTSAARNQDHPPNLRAHPISSSGLAHHFDGISQSRIQIFALVYKHKYSTVLFCILLVTNAESCPILFHLSYPLCAWRNNPRTRTLLYSSHIQPLVPNSRCNFSASLEWRQHLRLVVSNSLLQLEGSRT